MSDAERIALAMWQSREVEFPAFTRRMQPDDIDRETGAWAYVLGLAHLLLAEMRDGDGGGGC